LAWGVPRKLALADRSWQALVSAIFRKLFTTGFCQPQTADFPPKRHFAARKPLFSVGFTGGLGACE
jgi:hypothetical protein